MVCDGHLLLHITGANADLLTAIAYRSISRYGYCVSCTILCGEYHDTPLHQCIVPGLPSSINLSV